MSHLGVTGDTNVNREGTWGDRDPPDLGGFQVEAVTGTLQVMVEKPPGESESLVPLSGVGCGGKGPFGVTVWSPWG